MNNPFTMTQRHVGGVKSTNTFTSNSQPHYDPFHQAFLEKDNNVVAKNMSYNTMDLDVSNYSQRDLFSLFKIEENMLTAEIMKRCKGIVLKTHPDKSRLPDDYFRFFSAAYEKLCMVYDTQQKMKTTTNVNIPINYNVRDIDQQVDTSVFDALQRNKKGSDKKEGDNKKEKGYKKSNDFESNDFNNEQFNQQFEKNKIEEDAPGYGDWLKSNEDIQFITANITSASGIHSEMEKHKKRVQSMVVYKGVSDTCSNSSMGTSLMEHGGNFTSGNLFSGGMNGYTDLRQAYLESVIPVTQEDMAPTYSMDEYSSRRKTDIAPLSNAESLHYFEQQEKTNSNEFNAIQHYWAQQNEKRMGVGGNR
jgi:curved DNA-binding protein CbpA